MLHSSRVPFVGATQGEGWSHLLCKSTCEPLDKEGHANVLAGALLAAGSVWEGKTKVESLSISVFYTFKKFKHRKDMLE